MKHRGVLTVLVLGLIATYEVHAARAAQPKEDASVGQAKAVLASSLDPALPSISLHEWMTALIGEGGLVRWFPLVCPGAHKHPAAEYQVCVWVRGEMTTKRAASVVVWLGTGRVGQESWGKPRAEEMFVEAANDAVTVERLGALPQMLRLPASRWPKADLRIGPGDVACKPPKPVAGKRVTCDVTIHNDGSVAAPALLSLGVIPAESDVGIGKPWQGRIEANSRTTIALDLDWPEGKSWVVSVNVELLTASASGKRMLSNEPNTANNRTYLRIP